MQTLELSFLPSYLFRFFHAFISFNFFCKVWEILNIQTERIKDCGKGPKFGKLSRKNCNNTFYSYPT